MVDSYTVYPEAYLKEQVLLGNQDALDKLEDLWSTKYSPSIECFLCLKSFHENAYRDHSESCNRKYIDIVRKKNIYYSGLLRVSKQPLYHRRTALESTSSVNFFYDWTNSQVNSEAQSEIICHPAIKNGMLLAGNFHYIYGISIIPSATESEKLNDYLKIWQDGRVKIVFNNTFVAANLLSKQVLTNPAELPYVNYEGLIKGLDVLKCRAPLTVSGMPLELAELQTFTVSLDWEKPLTQNIPLYCVLYGILATTVSS